MPVLYITGPSTGNTLELTELSVIESYIAHKYGFLSDNSCEDNQILVFNSSTQALFDKFVTMVIRAPEVLRAQMKEHFILTQIGHWAKYHERALQVNGANGLYLGDGKKDKGVTQAELKLATVSDVMIKLSGDKFISQDKTPAILKVCERVEAGMHC